MPKNRAIRRFLGIFSFSLQNLTRIVTANFVFFFFGQAVEKFSFFFLCGKFLKGVQGGTFFKKFPPAGFYSIYHLVFFLSTS